VSSEHFGPTFFMIIIVLRAWSSSVVSPSEAVMFSMYVSWRIY
jgi:hypothetical protein